MRVWSADAVSNIGSEVTALALPLTAIFVLHASTFEVAFLATAGSVPYLVFGIPAGIWVDRVRRRPVMVGADVARAAVVVSVPAAYVAGALTLPHLYIAAFANRSLAVVFEVAAQSLVSNVVPRPSLIEANAKIHGTRVVAQGAGPAAGGGLVSLVGAPLALLADAVSFVVSAALLSSVPQTESAPTRTDRRTVLRDLREGAAYVLRHPYLRPLLLGNSLANLSLGVLWGIVIVFAVRLLGLSAGLVGLVLSLGQIGGFLGAALGRKIASTVGLGRAIVGAFFLFGPATAVLAAAPRAAPLPFLAVGWTLENLARAVYAVCAQSVRQAIVPDRLQARVAGFLGTAGTGAFPLGTVAGGVVAAAAGLRAAMIVAVAVSFTPFSRWRCRRCDRCVSFLNRTSCLTGDRSARGIGSEDDVARRAMALWRIPGIDSG